LQFQTLSAKNNFLVEVSDITYSHLLVFGHGVDDLEAFISLLAVRGIAGGDFMKPFRPKIYIHTDKRYFGQINVCSYDLT
jgi:hypothetical protein